MMKKIFLTSFFLSSLIFSPNIFGKTKKEILRVAYFNSTFGHIHRNPTRYSSSLTTISCGHPIKILKLVPDKGRPVTLFSKVWHFVKVGPYEGYINQQYLSDKKPECFQDRYPRFFDSLDLDLTELYYWGRLYDQYVFGKSRIR